MVPIQHRTGYASKRRRLLLLAVIFIPLLGLLWIGAKGHAMYRQEMVVRQLEQMGAVVLYDYNSERVGNYSLFAKDGTPPGPRWMRRILGDRVFGRVILVNLGVISDAAGHATDDDISCIRHLPYLEYLILDQTNVTDVGLAHIERLPFLLCLDLSYTEVTDDGMIRLVSRPSAVRLKELRLEGSRVTPRGAAEIRKLLPNTNVHS